MDSGIPSSGHMRNMTMNMPIGYPDVEFEEI
jgi:hypothetical protein